MGRSYLFECSKCGYHATVSGGADEGGEFSVQTIACRDCRVLFDCVVRWRVPDTGFKFVPDFRLRLRKSDHEMPPSFEAALSRLPLLDIRKFKWVQFKPRCAVSLAHRVQAWNDPGKCPRCNNFMDKNALPFRCWD